MADITNDEVPFPEAPAPWKCKGESFWFFGYAKGTDYPGLSFFNPLEGASTFAAENVTGKFKGGLTSILVVRYTESPVGTRLGSSTLDHFSLAVPAGPYDEIIWVPGEFEVPLTGKKANRITRIYVSSRESVYNGRLSMSSVHQHSFTIFKGRKNWNICKTLAHFEFTPNPDTSNRDLPYSRIAIAPPESPDAPFFLVDLIFIPLLSKGVIPFSSAFLPISTEAVCPPLPQSLNWRDDALVGTDRWISSSTKMKGNAGLFRFRGALEGGRLGDGVGFPTVEPWPVAMWLKDFELDFPVGIVLDKKNV